MRAVLALLCCLGMIGPMPSTTAVAQETAALTPKALQTALDAKPGGGADADRLAERIRTSFGGAEALSKGGAPIIDDLLVAFALEATMAPNAPAPRVVSDAVFFTMPLVRVGTSNVYAGVAQLSHGTAFTWHYEVGDRRMGGSQLEVYETHPDSKVQPGVPRGTVRQMPA